MEVNGRRAATRRPWRGVGTRMSKSNKCRTYPYIILHHWVPSPCRISPSEGHQIHEYILPTCVHQSFKGNPRIASGPEPEYHHDSDMNLSRPHTTAKNAVQFRAFLCIYDTFMIYDHVFSQFSPQCRSCQGRSEHSQFYSKASVASWLQLSMSVIRSDSFRMQSIWSIGTRSFDMERSRFCIQTSALVGIVGYCFRHELYWKFIGMVSDKSMLVLYRKCFRRKKWNGEIIVFFYMLHVSICFLCKIRECCVKADSEMMFLNLGCWQLYVENSECWDEQGWADVHSIEEAFYRETL